MGYYLSGGQDDGLLRTIGTLWPPLMRDQANSPGRKFSWRFRETSMLVWFLANARPAGGASLREVNPPAPPDPARVVAVVGVQLIDGRSGPPVTDATVVVRGDRVIAAGRRDAVTVPGGAEVVSGHGGSLIPGLIDAHFHIERLYQLPAQFLKHGVTSVRDPGEWIHVYDPVRQPGLLMPRFFLTGPHLDQKPVAHPGTSLVVETAEDTRRAVNRFVDEGASAIKVYYHLPPELIRVACATAHERGVPVTAHLEIVDADAAIRAGLDGVEHVTSFGTALADPRQAERFRADVTLDNRARGPGRYALWSAIDLDTSPRVKPLIELLRARKTVVSPTLAVFEVRRGDKGATDERVRGYETMLRFVGLCHRAGIPIVVGSHSDVPKAERGWAYHRELELLVECGLTPLEAIGAATRNNAAFFRVSDRLGTIEPDRQADLVLIDGDPRQDIKTLRQVRGVMLGGRWVVPPASK
jgi:imidazolonepropionase-like amidohydrolase